jgi:hypothetical protein
MNKREWKYLRHQYRKRKGHFKIGYSSFTIKNMERFTWPPPYSDDPFKYFAMMMPSEPFKPIEIKKTQRTRSEERYFLPLTYISTTTSKRPNRIINF